MDQNRLRAAVVYISPAGTTHRVARTLVQALEDERWNVEEFDLSRQEPQLYPRMVERFAGGIECLFVGSPVYVDRAVPPIVQFLTQLPPVQGCYGVPFVTWGGVDSGVALLEMAQLLEERGYALLGAAKILAVHSLMWNCEHPLGEGHPDSVDEALIQELVRGLTSKLQGLQPPPVSLQDLHYQPPDLELRAWNNSLDIAKKTTLLVELDAQLCNQCGVCQEECPVRAIELAPFVKIGDACIRCCNCVRLCPEGAIKVELTALVERIRKRSQGHPERPLSQIFV